MLPMIFCLALEVGIIPGPGFDQSLLMPEYALYQAVELEVVVYNHVFLGGSARLYEWDHFDCQSVGSSTELYAGIRLFPFEIGWRYQLPHALIGPFPAERRFPAGEYHEFYLRMSTKEK